MGGPSSPLLSLTQTDVDFGLARLLRSKLGNYLKVHMFISVLPLSPCNNISQNTHKS